jgi:hypothetical protein
MMNLMSISSSVCKSKKTITLIPKPKGEPFTLEITIFISQITVKQLALKPPTSRTTPYGYGTIRTKQ